jgi:hypothetical protein
MADHIVNVLVAAPIEIECKFWIDEGTWHGALESLHLSVSGTSFEDAKNKMQAALQDRFELLLHSHIKAQHPSAA